MRISFSNEATARAAVAVLEHYGYQATPKGAAIEAECPALLAVPAVGKAVGLHQIEEFTSPRCPGNHGLN